MFPVRQPPRKRDEDAGGSAELTADQAPTQPDHGGQAADSEPKTPSFFCRVLPVHDEVEVGGADAPLGGRIERSVGASVSVVTSQDLRHN